MQTVDSTGKILLIFQSHDLSHERSGNSGGEQGCLPFSQKNPEISVESQMEQ